MTQAIITPEENQQAAPSPITVAPETIAKFTQDATSRQYGKVTESDLVGNRQGVLATARDRNGMVSQEITGESVIEFRGMAMSVDRAVKVGILRSDGNGGYEEVSQTDRISQEAKAELERQQEIADRMAPETDLATIDREAPQMLADLIQGAETHGYQVEQITTELLCKRDVFHQQTLPSIAKKLGMTVEQVATQVNRISEAVEQQMRETLSPMGVLADPFFNWLDQQGSKGAAVYAQAFRGNYAPFKAIAEQFRQNHPQGRTASPHVHKTPGGRRVVTVSLPGGKTMQVSEATALRMGLI